MSGPPPEIDGFSSFIHRHGAITHPVYRAGNGPAVLLMHELPGMSPPCVELARELVAAGFTVFMPLFFGRPNGYETGPLALASRLWCIRHEFWVWSKGGGSPIVAWLRDLSGAAREMCRGAGTGVIGMCLTGNFAIAMMADPTVAAAVAAEPSLPIADPLHIRDVVDSSYRSALVVTDTELAEARRRARGEGVPLMCLRFTEDKLSPVERFHAARAAFGDAFQTFPPGAADGIPSGAGSGLCVKVHSVLTDQRQSTQKIRAEARAVVIGFLRSRLPLP